MSLAVVGEGFGDGKFNTQTSTLRATPQGN